ncbi:MAG: hypothetical protein ACD_49C00054G0008 [uncultured bacterium (gcode 4)]|uniref:Uncharacterized protein n=1 Tax=uncultured bacterium (gcode 4) TaxID=1234023 RepID=K2AX45_9BACT|nr:MAG: hypothetical protein ACD_49C00054G0008 [uncultured bacterium (gcode 4)]
MKTTTSLKTLPNKRPVFFGKTSLKNWFTLTELLIVISILAILATIGFLSFQWYSKSARDSTRITDIKSIQQWLAITKVKSWVYPIPEWDTLEILVWTGILIQWYIWENISSIIKINKLPLDPKDAKSYIYAVDKDRKKAQLLWYLENWETINLSSFVDINNQVYAESSSDAYQNRQVYTIWDKLWILTDENKIPLQEVISGTWINLNSEDTSNIVAYFWWDTYGNWKSTGTWNTLITQIQSAITNTIPCNPATYSGYTIPMLSHNQTSTFTKPITIANWVSIWSLQIQCINWNLDTVHAVETTAINCNSNYVLDNSTCMEDKCIWNAPDFSIANWTQKYNTNWIYNATSGICTFDCQTNYTYNSWSTTCTDQTPPIITYVVSSNPSCETIRYTILATDALWLASSPYSFDGWSTWQAWNTKDVTWTSNTLWTNLVKVRDAVGNVATYGSEVNGTSNSCQQNPTSLTLTHTANNKNFSISWMAWIGNGWANGCKIQYSKDNSTWTDLTWLTYNCDSNLTTTSLSLPGDGWWVWSTVYIRIANTTTNSIWQFSTTPTCAAKSSSTSVTPLVDEDCNWNWDNTTSVYVSQTCSNYVSRTCNGTYVSRTCTGAYVSVTCTGSTQSCWGGGNWWWGVWGCAWTYYPAGYYAAACITCATTYECWYKTYYDCSYRTQVDCSYWNNYECGSNQTYYN